MNTDYLNNDLRVTVQALRAKAVSVRDLAENLGTTRQTIYSRMEALEKLGFTIERKVAKVGKLKADKVVFKITKGTERLIDRELALLGK